MLCYCFFLVCSPTIDSEQSALENGVVQTKPARHRTTSADSQDGNTYSDKESLVRNETQLSTRDAHEEPASDEDVSRSSLGGRKSVPQSTTSTASRDKKHMFTSSQDYEDVNVIRARKAKQKEQKAKKEQQKQAKQKVMEKS